MGIVVAQQKYYKGLYRDLSDRYLGVKNSNKNTSEFLTLSKFMAFSWHFWPFQASIPASFSSVVVRYIYDIKGVSKVRSDFFFA